ncbi:MAG: PEP-CTERM sorting domain-containing protein [Tepidisphaera sp.]|nr:PEP-CTERM sorting domain-containing protein [Tepidisphaera sp.]
MKKVLGSIVAVAGLAVAANAASTTIKYEVSKDGGNTWSSSATAAPGTEIQVRARVIWSGTDQVFGLSQVVFQPIVSNWGASDSLETFAGGSAGQVGPIGGSRTTPLGTVDDAPGQFGRITPFGANAIGTSTYLRGHVGTGTAAGMLRIAQANVTNWVGVGATSGSTAANNWNGNGGVSVAQVAPGTRLPTDPAYNGNNDVVVFKFGFVLGSDTAARTLTIDTPATGLGHETNTTTGQYGSLYAAWFTSSTAAQGFRYYNDIGTNAASVSVQVVPAPASLALLGLGGLVAGRRRR